MKAMSNAMWLIVAIVVALVVALTVITVVNSTVNKSGEKGSTILDVFGETLLKQSCTQACDKCKDMGGGTCKDSELTSGKCKNYC